MSFKAPARRLLKRYARRALVEACALFGAPSGDHVLTYHRIGRKAEDASWVTQKAFGEQMRFLAAHCQVLTPESLLSAPPRGIPGMPRVSITIDDGHVSALRIAAPMLRQAGLPAVFFIPTDAIGSRDQLTRAHIRELADEGFVIGSHSCSHRSMPSLPLEERNREARDSRRALEDITGRTVTTFAYPFGTRADFDAASEQALAAAGYVRAFTSQHGPIRGDTHPLRMPRVKIEASDSVATFGKIAAGAGDLWQWVDRYLSRLQRGPHRRPVGA